MNYKQGLENNLKLFIFSEVCRRLSRLFYPILFLFYTFLNVDLELFGYIVAATSLTTLLMEIPSGIFADKYGRKNAYMLGQAFLIIIALIFIFYNNFIGLLIAGIMYGFSASFFSGADKALIFDSFKELKRSKEFRVYNGKLYAYTMGCGAIGTFFSGLIAEYS